MPAFMPRMSFRAGITTDTLREKPLQPKIQPGMTVPIPCRGCGKSLIRFTVAAGDHSVLCEPCGTHTEVNVRKESDGWAIRTKPGKPPNAP